MTEQGKNLGKITDIVSVARVSAPPAEDSQRQGFVGLGAKKNTAPTGGFPVAGDVVAEAQTFTPLPSTRPGATDQRRGFAVLSTASSPDGTIGQAALRENAGASVEIPFGDFTVREDTVDRLTPGEFGEYEDNFRTLQGLVQVAAPEARTTLVSDPFLRVFMGFAAESGGTESPNRVEDMSAALQAIARESLSEDDPLEGFAVLRGANSKSLSLHLINLRAASRIIRSDILLQSNLRDLGYAIPATYNMYMDREELTTLIKALYGQEDGRWATYARGVFSGFPSSAANAYSEIDPHDRHPLIDVDPEIVSDLIAGRNIERYEALTFERPEQQNSAGNSQDGSKRNWRDNPLWKMALVSKFGINFRTGSVPNTLAPDEMEYCQRLLEIDRRLGLTDYITGVEERGATVEHMARAKDDPWFRLKSEQWVEFRKKQIVNHREVADMTNADFFTFGYFDALDMTWADLEGKDVLDVGAGTAHFAYDCKQRGIDVVSVDNNPDYMGDYHLSHKDDVPYIIADGADTRLPDESFDLVVSHAGMVDCTRRQVRKWIAEADRVLKPGGEFRFTAWFKGGEPDFVSRNPNITSYIPFNPYTHGEFVADNTNVPVFIYKKPAAAS